MKKPVWIALACVVFLASNAFAVERHFGVGLILGEPTGASAKLWGPRDTAFQFATAVSFQDESGLHLHGDFILHKHGLFEVSRGTLPLYYGAGLRVKFFDSDALIGIRFPVGVNYLFDVDPLDAFFEVVPILDIAPDADFSINVSLGARYYFP